MKGYKSDIRFKFKCVHYSRDIQERKERKWYSIVYKLIFVGKYTKHTFILGLIA